MGKRNLFIHFTDEIVVTSPTTYTITSLYAKVMVLVVVNEWMNV